jgi:L-seryl-tRNA(Ser) seleniumtransferase
VTDRDPRRQLPSVDALLGDPEVAPLLAEYPRAVVVRAVRVTLDQARGNGGAAPSGGWARAVAARARETALPALTSVINATGVVLHTNLGRAVLARSAIDALTRVAGGYVALEYDLGRGTRGSRHLLCRDLLVELTGAEDAMVVNNAAAALLLALSAQPRGGEAIVSRGELIEIGGQFRIPDILARSGATLVEVGTTNRTHPDDYTRAMSERTRLLLKVHRSNFQVTGFTADVSAQQVAALAHSHNLLNLYDLGSGLLMDLAPWQLEGEPLVSDAVASGADAVILSGDKLLGGPQAGIILGTKEFVATCRADPVARAVRADKFTFAALEATLQLYRDPERARREIPVLAMLTADPADLKRRAEALAKALPASAGASVVSGTSEVGGGSFPGVTLGTWLVQLAPRDLTPDTALTHLRDASTPVIGRIANDHVMLDPRTVLPGEDEALVRAVREAIDG